MLSIIHSAALLGIDAYAVNVEVDLSSGLPAFDIVGLPDSAVKESRERVRTAIKNTGLSFPSKRITVNLAPADTKKEGASFDLPLSLIHICVQSFFLGRRFCIKGNTAAIQQICNTHVGPLPLF